MQQDHWATRVSIQKGCNSAIQRVSVIFQQKSFATYLVRVLNGSINRVRGKGTRGHNDDSGENKYSCRVGILENVASIHCFTHVDFCVLTPEAEKAV